MRTTAITITSTVVLDTRKALKDGTYPLKLRVGNGKNDNRKYSILGLSFTPGQYNKLLANATKEPYKDTWNKIESELKRGEKIIKGLLPRFKFSAFKERFASKSNFEIIADQASILYVLGQAKESYIEKNQYPMYFNVKTSVRSILIYAKQDDIPMQAITPQFCREYETYMVNKSKKNSRNGVGINLRHIRILFNLAIREGLIPRECYPFKRMYGEKSDFKNPYVIPNERKSKDYLNETEIVKFSEANDFDTDSQKRAHFAWLVSYYCNGANAADFLKFKYRDIKNNFIEFYREKIKNSTRGDRMLTKIFITPELQKLIDEFGNPPLPDNYIFKCYHDGMTEEEMFHARRKFNESASKSGKVLGAHLGIKTKVRLGNARHSLANVMKKNKVDREFAKDIFGHTSILSADNYYGSFEDDQIKEIATNITSVSAIKKKQLDNKF